MKAVRQSEARANAAKGTRRARGGTVRALLALAVVLFFAPPWSTATAAPTPLNLNVSVINEGFEGAFPAGLWFTNDTNLSSGEDGWGPSNFRQGTGTTSLWSAGNGTQLATWDAGPIAKINLTNATNTILFHEDFETGGFAANWNASDDDNTSGNDTWGLTTHRAYTGNWSMWSSEVGYNDELNDWNVNVTSYDNYQLSYVWHPVDTSNASNTSTILMDYWYWLDSEANSDYFYALYEDAFGGWWYQGYYTGNSGGWTYDQIDVGVGAVAIGFLFYSDSSTVAEGAYVDNITLYIPGPPQPAQPAGNFKEDFETGAAAGNWSVWDDDSYAGRDYWGPSTARAHTGTSSLWSAQVGSNSEWGMPNTLVPAYDDGQYSMATRPIVNTNLSAFPSITFSFWYWLDSEQGFDYLWPMYFNASSGWTSLNSWDGSSGGWVFATFDVPNDTKELGFLFSSDTSVVYEGAYIDDIEVKATRDDPNARLGTYDTYENTTLRRSVDMTPYAQGYMSYSYWLQTDSSSDTFEAMYMVGGAWTTLDRRTGTSGGWQSAQFAIPTNATQIGFRFVSDGVGHAEGAYLDDIRVWGVVYPVNCTANVGILTGMESVTPFLYTLQATDGLRPYTYRWAFGDGGNATQGAPSRTFAAVGTYSANVTITDALGQTCVAQAPTVTITHDITTISVEPSSGSLVEGQSVSINAYDAKGHSIPFDWSLSPSECGELDATNAPAVAFTSFDNSGGKVCTVRATAGSAHADAVFQMAHDSSVVTLMPSTADLIEGEGVSIAAVDRYGHSIVFGWSTTCGQVTPLSGAQTTLTANDLGGETCRVTASGALGNATATVRVLHDTRALTLSPTAATVIEGAGQSFAAVDKYGHPAPADWSVTPSTCGHFSPPSAATSTFTASTDSGGLTCTVTAMAGAGSRSAEVTVRHSTSGSTIAPAAATVVEGGTQVFHALDTFGHPLQVTWLLAPTQCGALSAELDTVTTLTVGATVGAGLCTVSIAAAGVHAEADVTVVHGAPKTLQLSANLTSALEAGVVSLDAAVKDAAGHTLGAVEISWQATCGQLQSDTGRTNILTVSPDAGGQTCYVNLTAADLTASATIQIRHAGPFTIAITATGGAGSQTLVAVVTDRRGHHVTDNNVTWSTTCGSLSTTKGPSVLYTPPSSLGGSSCRVTATTTTGVSGSEASLTLATGMSLVVPIVAILAVAGAVAMLVIMKRRRNGGEGDDGVAPPETPQ